MPPLLMPLEWSRSDVATIKVCKIVISVTEIFLGVIYELFVSINKMQQGCSRLCAALLQVLFIAILLDHNVLANMKLQMVKKNTIASRNYRRQGIQKHTATVFSNELFSCGHFKHTPNGSSLGVED